MKLLLGARIFAFVTVSLPLVIRWQVVRRFWCNLFIYSIPNRVNHLPIFHPFEDTIASNHEKVEVVFEFETSDLRVANDNVRISAVLLPFRLYVTKCTWYWKSAWEHPQRSLNVKVFLFGWCCGFSEGLSAVYFSTRSLDTNSFLFVIGFVVSRYNRYLSPCVKRH